MNSYRSELKFALQNISYCVNVWYTGLFIVCYNDFSITEKRLIMVKELPFCEEHAYRPWGDVVNFNPGLGRTLKSIFLLSKTYLKLLKCCLL